VERLSGHRRGAFCPLGRDSGSGQPGSDELPYRVVSGAAHHFIVSPRWNGDQHARFVVHVLLPCQGAEQQHKRQRPA
jgi:hypothetical protein